MGENEELHVIEVDQGDGWTRVRRMMTGNVVEEGFVPTSYIESTLYAQVVEDSNVNKNVIQVLIKLFLCFSVDHIYINNV